MAVRDWSIEAEYVEYCSCDYGCPCESQAPPTQGHCTGAVAFKINKGHCDGINLDGLIIVATFYFPRAIHHGEGHMQPILEARTTPEQRDALFYILTGEDQPVGTMFQIFSQIIEHHHDPIFTEIGWEWDIKNRRARIDVPKIVRAHSEAIRNPVTDEEHRIITVLPEGWVFHEAEGAAGFAKGIGDIKFDLAQRHSSLAYVAWNRNGLSLDLVQSRKRFPLV
jgi:hypothetical protein